MDNDLRFSLALLFAKSMNKVIDIINKDRGSNFSGEKAMIIDPKMVAHFKNIDPEKVIFITGTNGKSSCTNLVTHILRENGFKVISNLEGANLLAGLATSLSKESNIKGELEADYYVFETDERFLPLIYEQLPAANLLIMNLQKDQVQRNGDPDFIIQKLESFVNPNIRLFLNNDEPRSKAFERFSDKIVTFGVEENEATFTKDETYPTEPCPKCNHGLVFNSYNVDSVGSFECPNCGFKSENFPNYYLKNVNFKNRSFTINGITGSIPYDLPFMLYNYVAATALCKEVVGLAEEDIFKTFDSFENIKGRFEEFNFGNKKVKYMRIKQENPDTLQNAINIMANDKEPKSIYLGLYPVEDIIPSYMNIFYTYDCDFSNLIDGNVDHFYCFSPAVCYDTAQRLRYDGVDEDKLIIEETNDPERIFQQIQNDTNSNIYLITLLHIFEELKAYGREHK